LRGNLAAYCNALGLSEIPRDYKNGTSAN